MEYDVEYIIDPSQHSGHMKGFGEDVLQQAIDQKAREGWRLHSIVPNVSPAVTPGYYLIFERV